jgi:3-oxoacyl-[acyl-carrier protein] reductase
VAGLGLNLAIELAPYNILVNTVCPGPILTERLEDAIRATAEQDGVSMADAELHWLDLIPLHRFGGPEDLGDLVAYLASDRGGFITGTVTQVDGGKAIW